MEVPGGAALKRLRREAGSQALICAVMSANSASTPWRKRSRSTPGEATSFTDQVVPIVTPPS
jgi:hypothetical protein